MSDKYKKLKKICEYLIYKSNEDRIPLTNKKLQKLLYYIQALSLHRNGEEAFDVDFEAWVHGAVIPIVYNWYSGFGYNLIVQDSIDIENIRESVDDKTLAIIDEVWSKCSKYDANYLENVNHDGQAWQNARKGLGENDISNNRIEISSIRDHSATELAILGLKK